MAGWIKISRDIHNHWIWEDDTKLKWWLDMLITVNFKDSKILLGNKLIDCKRGQSIMSLKSWATRWNVDKNKVRNFFVLLEKDGMITHENLSKSTRITICKYESYQGVENANETQTKRKRNANETQTNPIEESKENKEEEESKEFLLEKESKKILFDSIWALYGKKGTKELSKNKFLKLKQSEIELMLIHIPIYLASVKDKQFVKNFETYINQKHWQSEINGVLVTTETLKQELTEYVYYKCNGWPNEEVTRAEFESIKKGYEGGGYVFTELKSTWK